MSSSKTHDEAALWREFTNALGEAGVRVHARMAGSGVSPGQIDQCLLHNLSLGALYLSQLNSDRPDWIPFLNSRIRSGNPSPDTIYSIAAIAGDGTYRLWGERNSVRMVNIQIFGQGLGFHERPKLADDFNLDDLALSEDGSFEVLLSGERPHGYQGNWRRLDPAFPDPYVIVRQVSYDWLGEEDARIFIERFDASEARLTWSEAAFAERLRKVPLYVERVTSMVADLLLGDQKISAGDVNTVQNVTTRFAGVPLIQGQDYSQADIVIAADEALLLEFRPPSPCPYWSLQLMDEFYTALDFSSFQTGVNGHTAAVDSDGLVRVLISERDCGAPNWLDKGDYPLVRLRGRWFGCAAPDIKTMKMKIAEAPTLLAPDAALVSTAERRQALRRRNEGAQKRRRW